MVFGRVLGLVLGLSIVVSRLGAQAWDTPRVLTMVQRATDRRVQQLADSGLVGYQATAHGYLTFLAQLGEGFREIPRVVKADELALEVYWRAPNLSKQRIIGRRDTTLLPTDIEYHRDHLGIIQNDFPAIIRLGEGDEVRDVPHPLSESGLMAYQFALTDSLRISSPGRVVDVYEVQIRPRNDRLPGVVGAVYLDRDNARVVRMAFNFTRASFLDQQLEDVSIVLENGLVGSRFWLPRRQEVEIRRTLTWLDYPVRGIIRGRWDIRDYVINTDLPVLPFFGGPEITQSPPAQLKAYAWTTPRLVDSLPAETRLPTPIEIRRVQDAARLLIREQAIRRPRNVLAANSASEFVRYDRVGGLAVGAGASFGLGGGVSLDSKGRYEFATKRGRGSVAANWRTATGSGMKLYLSDDVRDVGDFAERSGLVNSLAAQEVGSDLTDRFRVRAVGLSGTLVRGATTWTLGAAIEGHEELTVHATPFSGKFRPGFAAGGPTVEMLTASVDRAATSGPFGVEWRAEIQSRLAVIDGGIRVLCQLGSSLGGIRSCAQAAIARGALKFQVERSFGSFRLSSRTFGAAAMSSSYLLAQELVFLGGPVSMPGYAYHSLIGDRAMSQEVELRIPVPFPGISLGRFGHSPSAAGFALHGDIAGVHQVAPATGVLQSARAFVLVDPFRTTSTGWYRSAGVSLITAFDLVRLDLSRAVPTGRWVFSFDVSRAFWSIM